MYFLWNFYLNTLQISHTITLFRGLMLYALDTVVNFKTMCLRSNNISHNNNTTEIILYSRLI